MESSEKTIERIRVLLIEDSDLDIKIVTDILSDQNEAAKGGQPFQLEVSRTLAESLQRLQRKDIDLILADLMLPDSEGIETFMRLHKECPELPIVILSGVDEPDLPFEVVKLGAEDYLAKNKLNVNNLPRIIRYSSERRRIQKKIYLAEERYRGIFENSAAAIMLADEKGLIVSWNKFAEDLLGMRHEDLYLRPVHSLYPDKEREKIRAYDILKKEHHDRFETKMIRKDGSFLDIDLSISVLKDDSGKKTGTIGVIKDITEQKKLERLKDEFVSTVSHELRTPLAIIREAVSQVHEGILGGLTSDQQKFLSISLENIDRLARIVNDLLDISRLEAGSIQLEKNFVNMTALIKKVCDSFEARLKKANIRLHFEAHPSAIELCADRDKVTQVITNLISNALKFTREGQITVTVRDFPDRVECCVADTGRGISQEDLPNVFFKFQQFGRLIGPGDQGTGLGLAISKSLIELHRGRIWVESEQGKGSQFTFSLPKFTAEDLFIEKITEGLQRAVRSKTFFSIMVVRVRFEGGDHSAKDGEKLGRVISYLKDWILKNLPRKNDATIEDVETVMMTLTSTTKEEALIFAGRIRQILDEALAKEKLNRQVQVVCRVAGFPEDGQTAEQLLQKLEILHHHAE